MLEKILSNSVADLVYRFLLWVLFSIFLHTLAIHADSTGGKYIAAAIAKPSNGIYWNVLLCIGLLLMILSVITKDILVNFSNKKQHGKYFEQLAFIIGKISSDLILSGYGAASFLIGWGIFSLNYNNKENQLTTLEHLTVLAFIVALTASIGLMSLLARTKPESKYMIFWLNKVPGKWRLLSYIIVFSSNAAILWFYPFTKPQ